MEQICLVPLTYAETLRFGAVDLSIRLLPMQVLGKQRTSTAFKAKACLRMLALECDVGVAKKAVRSILTDMGVESGLWLLPDLTSQDASLGLERCFPFALPLADSDHLLHHCMCEIETGYTAVSKELWLNFDSQLSALAKVFSKRDHVELYIKANILDNPRVPREAKKSLSSMFTSTCPTYCKSRWHFAYDVMNWMAKREALIQWLEPEAAIRREAAGAGGGGGPEELSKAEGEGLRKLASDPQERAVFWSIFWTTYRIQSWGYGVHIWLHDCPCPAHRNKQKTQKRKRSESDQQGVAVDNGWECCKLKGRRMIELAAGKANGFSSQLGQMQWENYEPAAAAIRRLKAFGAMQSETADAITRAFMVAKRKVMLRFDQGTSFYSSFPWSLVSLLQYVVEPSGQQRATAVVKSKRFAAELCQRFDSNQLPTSNFAGMFFQGQLLESLRAWGTSESNVMDNELFHEILSFGLSLTSMQRLEGRHHLVNLKVGPSRASSAATVSAALRRRQNCDWQRPSFRSVFETNLQRFHLLVPEEWSSMSELHRLVSGQHLEIMFQDTSAEDRIISQAVSSSKACGAISTDSGELVLFQQHVKTVLREGAFYAVPVCASGGTTRYEVVQVLSLKPSAKKYMERVVGVGWTGAADRWQDHVAVTLLGHCVVAGPAAAAIDLDAGAEAACSLCPLPCDKPFVSTTNSVEPYPLRQFFKFDFEHVYEFERVAHACKFAEDCLVDSLGSDDDDDEPTLPTAPDSQSSTATDAVFRRSNSQASITSVHSSLSSSKLATAATDVVLTQLVRRLLAHCCF